MLILTTPWLDTLTQFENLVVRYAYWTTILTADVYKRQEQHKETFERILSDIQGYQNQLDYWGKVNISHKQVIYPRFYKLDVYKRQDIHSKTN